MCDGSTIAWQFNQTTFLPVDVSNPEVLAAQLAQIDEILHSGVGEWADAIAWDNYVLSSGAACGTIGPDGRFVRRWDVEHPDAWADEVVAWTQEMATALHARGLLMVPNYNPLADWDGSASKMRRWDDPHVLAVGNASDAVLDEAVRARPRSHLSIVSAPSPNLSCADGAVCTTAGFHLGRRVCGRRREDLQAIHPVPGMA